MDAKTKLTKMKFLNMLSTIYIKEAKNGPYHRYLVTVQFWLVTGILTD